MKAVGIILSNIHDKNIPELTKRKDDIPWLSRLYPGIFWKLVTKSR